MACECVTGPGIRGYNPIWYNVNLDGIQFDDTYYLWVLQNEIPYIPAVVYHDPALTDPWTSPIQYLANGTLPTDVYWNPEAVYRLEYRKNNGTQPPSQNDQLIYEISNYIPGEEPVTPTDITDGSTNNQITNGQFSDVLFDGTYVLTATNPAPIEIAPGWFLELQGNGTVTLQQIPLNSALTNPTNAPYALRILLTGSWTGTPVLRQRFQQNGMLWANKYVSTSITARMDGTLQSLTARLDASNGAPLAILMNTSTLTNAFVQYQGNALLPATTNTDLPPNAYIDYKILLPTNVDLYISSIQVTSSAVAGNFAYEQDTIDRQIDHTFHYFKPQLEYKPTSSYLTGWNFPLNPAQFAPAGAVATGANGSFYAWDQTVVFQSVDNGVLVSRNANGGLTLTSNNAAGVQMAIIQYLDQTEARDILSGRTSVKIKLRSSDIGEILTVGLYATNDPTLPNLKSPDFDSLIATLDARGKVATFNGSWTPLLRSIPASNEITALIINQEYDLNSWIDNTTTPRVADATYFAIVIGTDNIANTESITFDYITLTAGDIATRPSPQTKEQVRSDCEAYYEMSYATSTDVATATNVNAVLVPQSCRYPTGGGPYNSAYLASSFTIEFKTPKRVNNPTMAIYSPITGTVANVDVYILGSAATHHDVGIARWTAMLGDKNVNYLVNTNSLTPDDLAVNATTPNLASLGYQYVADARLGVVL